MPRKRAQHVEHEVPVPIPVPAEPVPLLRKQPDVPASSMGEAKSFAAAMLRMAIRSKFTMSQDDWDSRDQWSPFNILIWTPEQFGLKPKRKRQQWSEALANVIARAHLVRVAATQGSNHLVFVGRSGNTALAAFIYSRLLEAAENTADVEYDRLFREAAQRGDVEAVRGARKQFLAGVADAFREVYRAELSHLTDGIPATQLKRLNDIRLEVDEYFNKLPMRPVTVVMVEPEVQRLVAEQPGYAAGYRLVSEGVSEPDTSQRAG